jgi:hypothetical protein
VISAKFSKSVKAKEKLKECGGIAVKTYCRTRWFSELHLVDSLLENHQRPGDPVAQVLAFLQCEELVPTPVVSKKKASRIIFFPVLWNLVGLVSFSWIWRLFDKFLY